MSDAIQLEAQVRCALISEGLCPYCRGPLVVVDGWGVCDACSVAHCASGWPDQLACVSRMIEHDSLEPLDWTPTRTLLTPAEGPR